METKTTVVFVLPPSPSDTNPPLGPAILARSAQKAGGQVFVRDLNISFLQQFRKESRVAGEARETLGDQGKDRSLAATAAAALYRQFDLEPDGALFVPDVATPEAGMHFSEAEIERSLTRQLSRMSDLAVWISSHLDEFQSEIGTPEVVGVSLMGPSQVFPSLLLLRLAKMRWQGVATVMGGSHVTLLAGTRDGAMLLEKYADRIILGHAEESFANLVTSRSPGIADDDVFEYEPTFEPGQLALYRRETLVLPVQFSRGCAYGKCTFCTYPVVEPVATRIDSSRAVSALRSLRESFDVGRFSLKDSLVSARDLLSLAKAIQADALSITWSATTLPRRVVGSMAAELAEGGLRTLEFGVESIHRPSQQLMRKQCSPDDVEQMIEKLAAAGVVSVVNLMFGFPGETEDQAAEQVAWAVGLKGRFGRGVDFSLNMLEIVRGSPMERETARFGVVGVAPWAYAYEWKAPSWRPEFAPRLLEVERR